MTRVSILTLALGVGVSVSSCSYRPYAMALEPVSEVDQPMAGMTVADDGTVSFTQDRLELHLRPLTDEELNRQFAAYSESGAHSVNPYTFGNAEFYGRTGQPQRFQVFRFSVKNYQYPKVRFDGDAVLRSDNGRVYHDLDLEQLTRYYRTYAIGYSGIEYNNFKERRAILQRTMFPAGDPVFSGQEQEGYVVFEPLADDVHAMTVTIHDFVTRFDYRGEPMEAIDVSFRFKRNLGRIYPDGRIEWTHRD